MKVLTQDLNSNYCVVLSLYYCTKQQWSREGFKKFLNELIDMSLINEGGYLNVTSAVEHVKQRYDTLKCNLIKIKMKASNTGYHYIVSYMNHPKNVITADLFKLRFEDNDLRGYMYDPIYGFKPFNTDFIVLKIFSF